LLLNKIYLIMDSSNSSDESVNSEISDPRDHAEYSIYSVGGNILELKSKYGKLFKSNIVNLSLQFGGDTDYL